MINKYRVSMFLIQVLRAFRRTKCLEQALKISKSLDTTKALGLLLLAKIIVIYLKKGNYKPQDLL